MVVEVAGGSQMNTEFSSMDETGSLNTVDREVLNILGADLATDLAFQGLKRKSGLHQETLSRALHRLEKDGLILKTDGGGYRLSEKGQFLTKNDVAEPTYFIPLLTTQLPSDIDLPQLVDNLRFKWFGDLRWYGISETKNGFDLMWVSGDGSRRLIARFTHSYLSIGTIAKTPREKDMSIQLAYDLFSNIAKVYRVISVSSRRMELSS
jgi:DNA-binding transcriptional ArsR family regulator